MTDLILEATPIDTLRQIQKEILEGINELQILGLKKSDIFQAKFTKVMTSLTNRMKKQIDLWKNKYIKFDKEVQKNQRLVKTSKQLTFFRDQCVNLQKQIHNLTTIIRNQKEQINSLRRQNQLLSACLLKKSKQNEKFKSRVLSLTRNNTDHDDKESIRKKKDSFCIQPKLMWKQSQTFFSPHQQKRKQSCNFDTQCNQEKSHSIKAKRSSFSGGKRMKTFRITAQNMFMETVI